MTSAEMTGWIAFIKLKNKREKDELDKNKPKEGNNNTFTAFKK